MLRWAGRAGEMWEEVALLAPWLWAIFYKGFHVWFYMKKNSLKTSGLERMPGEKGSFLKTSSTLCIPLKTDLMFRESCSTQNTVWDKKIQIQNSVMFTVQIQIQFPCSYLSSLSGAEVVIHQQKSGLCRAWDGRCHMILVPFLSFIFPHL